MCKLIIKYHYAANFTWYYNSPRVEIKHCGLYSIAARHNNNMERESFLRYKMNSGIDEILTRLIEKKFVFK